MKEKYGVAEDPNPPKVASKELTTCPHCGGPVQDHSGVKKCPKCGTRPWEMKQQEPE